MPKADAATRLQAQAHAVRLLNELEAVLTGWVLEIDRDTIAPHVDPLYELVDKD